MARHLVAAGVAPDGVVWTDGDAPADLFATPDTPLPLASDAALHRVRANVGFLDLARSALMHRAPERLGLLYRLLWRMQRAPRLMQDAADADVRAAARLAQAVRRDIHKMRAFVRFRLIDARYVAWFEPDHAIERANARFFIDRFASQPWSILTPRLSLHWLEGRLMEGPPASPDDAAQDDPTEALWTSYYRAIFNPARLKTGAMLREMPRKYWHNLPEARAIPELIAGAQAREAAMIDASASSAAPPAPQTLDDLAQAVATCRRCPIGANGTRAVMGEGPADAALMIVGEQPGDHEERAGRPFVGPAGAVLNAALAQAGIDRAAARITNAVRHFKHTPSPKGRLHQTPSPAEIDHCRWWLEAERAMVRPRHILALGASAARAILGRTPNIMAERGQPIPLPDGATLWITAHPAHLLRLEGAARAAEQQRFADDLARVARGLGSTA
ncbi:UdgX family uracil-DNA binding protein [Novosphingobium sp. FSY-8]|uniref:Type-4 uracil-DNA glycosylase n=2 Tax=Novosphingobium ovatum TaxID=1908523 RepID=A0ABW9XDA2_9SPHN|nr:UdgX family uracil-DNA binding protein [Novosphingobium ovatum]